MSGSCRLAWLLILLSRLSLGAVDFYVAPFGNDANPGTRNKPFASLERARDAVQEQKRARPRRDYTVWLLGGVYRLTNTLVFSLEDSAEEGHTITYAAYRGEKPVFSSGLPLTGWKKEGRLWTTALPESVKPFRTLYDRAGRLPRARSRGFVPTADYRTATNYDRFTVPFPKGALKKWPNLEDVEIMIRPNFGWVLNLLPLESVDEETGLARTAVPASYPMVKVRWGPPAMNKPGTAWVENVLEALDEPGEWAVNMRERKLYLWPRDADAAPEGIEAPQLTELIRIEGKIDYEGPSDVPVRGLVFRGITFTRGDRWPWEKERIGSTLQHDWEMFDRPTALVRLRGAEQIRFERCRWFDSGGAGVRMDLHARSNAVTDSVFEHLGGTGILLAGYGPGTKDVNRGTAILRNHIHHVGEILWHAPGISVWQSGENHLAHNLIHDVNYTAITVSGRINWNRQGRGDGWRTIRWNEVEKAGGAQLLPESGKRPEWRLREPFLHGRKNLVELNEIHDVMQKLWDGDAIYISGTGASNWIRENFIHDCLSENMCEGIRCDDDQDETIIERNVVWRNGGLGTGITSKGKNHIINNFLVESTATFNPRGMISIEASLVQDSIIQRNILMTRATNLPPFFVLNIMGPPHPEIKDLRADYNLFWNSADRNWAMAYLSKARAQGREEHSLVAEPLFRNPEQGDFRFKHGSPAEKLGIEPLDLRKAGLRGQ
jgi:hypothetical protein